MNAVVFLVLINLLAVYGSHFRGGTVKWKYLGDANKVEFKYSLSWAHGRGSAPSWNAFNLRDNTTFNIGSGNYSVVANNSAENWERGEATFIYNFPAKGPYRIRFTGGAWISLGYGSGGSWNIKTIVDLNNRSDTLNPNYSPSTFSRAIYRVQYGCKISIQIPVFDVDGDTFLVRVEASTSQCHEKPVFVSPTPSEGISKVLKATQTLNVKFYVQSNTNLMAIDVDGPRGLSKSNIKPDDQGRPNTWLVEVTWRPQQSDQGTHIMCASAEDQFRKLSDTRCINVIAWDIDPCDSSPCQHESTCKRVGYTADYICTCVPGYTGNLCETDIDECMSNPCMNGATCTDLVDGYTCSCIRGYNGTHCQLDIDECYNIPCYNNGTCVDGIDSWTCQCLQGFGGVHCQTDIDDCVSDPCQHNGTCIDLVDGYKCQCTNDSKGDNCETSKYKCQYINDAKGHKCETSKYNCQCFICSKGFNCETSQYNSQCSNGSKGNNCEKRIDHCSSSPCLHDGDCINGMESYACQCRYPWHGDRCEFKEINRTEVCTDLEYSECSCHISTLSPIKRKSYTLISGFTGLLIGLLLTVIYYIEWTLCNKTDHIKKVKPTQNIISVIDLESDKSSSQITKKTSNQTVEVRRQCNCFVDHSGYDHFQRFDKRLNNRFKFHCRHQKTNQQKTHQWFLLFPSNY
ncbi:Fibropellin-3,Sushi, von Willebrand factor type A, EGF and pentraxin domain-containing protein 1,Fibropellin-1,Protein eyes shut homolog [Mytilus edulis]|uniref:Fibropellin-3,Sushi, von Willebrand factor type A, EGF and pentraxin domain-containing protein 1,Fibropellin-1,Protein eyes shut homolog n=1 Tax=Mytilus edulis TaxID=6550 RepID=A0A8S3V2S8_MYTED|nr:Fibropellin-3,Sushi, von Willebrand factor type A, EGF and pentraxin domain-containing protein 1,Fibropellin-1,Protein eyes shut homolog [Mytilus edulis]